jgi:hypothetical protein
MALRSSPRSRPVHGHSREVAHAPDDGNRRCPWPSEDRPHGVDALRPIRPVRAIETCNVQTVTRQVYSDAVACPSHRN